MISNIERRACPRFAIPGALIGYKKIRLFGKRSDWIEQSCQLFDLSRGGIRFLTQKPLALETKLVIELSCPEKEEPLLLIGNTIWKADYKGDGFRYFMGIQLNPYGEGKKFNPVGMLNKIVGLEKTYLRP